MKVFGQRHAPAAFTPEKETRYPLYRRLCGPHGRSGRVREIPHWASIPGHCTP